MQQINESLSQSDCDDAQLYYNVWKTSSNISDTAVESRIAECVKAKEKSQQNTATMPNQIQQTADKQLQQQNIVTKGTVLTVSSDALLFKSSGENQLIEVSTNAKKYDAYYLPKWIKTNKLSDGNLQIICDKNTNSKSRQGSFYIYDGKKSVKVNVVQEGKR